VVREWLAVAIGGMLGSLLRYALSAWMRGVNPNLVPWSTLAVNVVGCFAIGWLFRWSLDRHLLNQWWEVGLRAGLLGGLTTFSAFGLETVVAWQQRPTLALAIVVAHVGLGLLAVVLGMALAGSR
jgi:fluoride exporter